MSTSDVLKVLNLKTFKTSRVTINPEMHEQVHTIFLFIIYSTKCLSCGRLRLQVVHARILQFFSFSRPCLPKIQPGLGSFQRVFVFRVFKFLNYVLV